MVFLTLEDYNSVNLDYVNEFYKLDTSNISEQEFENVLYDFVICNHSISGSSHTFTFEVHNSLWNGKYYLLKSNDSVLSVNGSYDSTAQTITITTDETSVQLVLYLCSFSPSFSFNRLQYIFSPLDTIVAKKDELGTNKTFTVKGIDGTSYASETATLTDGVISLVKGSAPANYVLCLLKKTDVEFNINQTLQVGIINNVRLNVDEDYLPSGALVDEDLLDIYVVYNGLEIPVTYDEVLNDYVFNLDLTAKLNNSSVNITLVVNENDFVNAGSYDFNLSCTYATADNFNNLVSQIVSGAEIIQLTSDIVFANNLNLPNQVYIIGDDYTIDFAGFGFVVNEGISVKCSNISFVNGSPCFIQHAGSKLVLDSCSFENASITDECKGSVIYTLNDNNITSELSNCSILNCHHSIYHSGSLSVKNIRALYNNFNESIDHDYPAFLTAYEGQVTITNSIFDIDYTTEEICTSQTDIKFAQSLIGIGETTVINGYSSNQIQANNSLHLTDSPFNNQSHIYCKYYYPSIEACVITSPLPNYEDKAVCHNIIGEDYVYKNNVQVTRASWQTENNDRKIRWED